MDSNFLQYGMFSILLLVSCSNNSLEMQPYEYTELAMQPGMRITATNKNGTIIIEAISPLKRRFQWGKFDETRILIPRKERWMGRLGAYDPASRFFWEFWKPLPRIVINDSQLHFQSLQEIENFLNQGRNFFDWIYTDYGLVVGFGWDDSRDQVNVNVYQIYLDGEFPKGLKDSRPEKIQVTMPHGTSPMN